MKNRTFVFLALASATFATMALVACSGDDTSSGNITLPRLDSSTGNDGTVGNGDATTGGDSSTGQDSSSGTDGTTGQDGQSGVDCGKQPFVHSLDGGNGPFCPFQADGSPGDCPLNGTCCSASTSSTNFCVQSRDAAACGFPIVPDGGAAAFECEGKIQCTGNDTCCMKGSIFVKDAGAACPPLYTGSHVLGTYCTAACAAGEPPVCAADSDCPNGTTCTPLSTRGIQLGYCKPN